MLTAEERRTLLDLARRSVTAACAGEPLPEIDASSALEDEGAAFVTLRKRGELRGCIGHIHAIEPLWRSVRSMARSAALKDPRFHPVRPEEIDELRIEISHLSPMRRIHTADELSVGEHGLYIKNGDKSGLLLPQVAANNGWDAKRFLENTCHKAELPLTSWQDPRTEIYVFTVELFEDTP